jgi:predicted TIM-barrel enzyme
MIRIAAEMDNGRRCDEPRRGRTRIQAVHDVARSMNGDVIVICHGGPIAGPEHTQCVLDHTQGIAGFCAASSMEWLPVGIAITENVLRFRAFRVS